MSSAPLAPSLVLHTSPLQPSNPRHLACDGNSGCLGTALKVAGIATCIIANIASFVLFGPIGGLITLVFTVPTTLGLLNSLLGISGPHVHRNPVYIPWYQRVYSWIPSFSWPTFSFPRGGGHVLVGGWHAHVPVGGWHAGPGAHVSVGGGHVPPSRGHIERFFVYP